MARRIEIMQDHPGCQLVLILNRCFFSMSMLLVPARINRCVAVARLEVLEQKSAFVRYAAHEIRSPFNVVMAGLDIVKEMSPGITYTEDMHEIIEDAYTSCGSAINILNDLLQYESIDAGKLVLAQEEKSVHLLLNNRLTPLTLLAKKHNIDLIIDDHACCTDYKVLTHTLCLSFIYSLYFSPSFTLNFSSPFFSFSFFCVLFSLTTFIQLKSKRCSHDFLDPSTLLVYIDIFKIDQVIRNLVTNAMKFTAGGGKICIRTSLVNRDVGARGHFLANGKSNVVVGQLRIEVIDSGIGISLENSKKVFGEFVQFDPNANQAGGGSGLGLMISRKIVHLHGGAMDFTSGGIGQGSTFFFFLPVYASTNFYSQIQSKMSIAVRNSLIASNMSTYDSNKIKDAIKASVKFVESLHEDSDESFFSKTSTVAPDRISSTSLCTTSLMQTDETSDPLVQNVSVEVDNTPIRMLVVDDSAMNRKIIIRLIKNLKTMNITSRDIDIDEADDGTNAIELVRIAHEQQNLYKCILLDSNMTLMHGPDCAMILRNDLLFRNAIIGVTGNGLPKDILHFKEKGANDVLIKPLDFKLFVSTLRKNDVLGPQIDRRRSSLIFDTSFNSATETATAAATAVGQSS